MKAKKKKKKNVQQRKKEHSKKKVTYRYKNVMLYAFLKWSLIRQRLPMWYTWNINWAKSRKEIVSHKVTHVRGPHQSCIQGWQRSLIACEYAHCTCYGSISQYFLTPSWQPAVYSCVFWGEFAARRSLLLWEHASLLRSSLMPRPRPCNPLIDVIRPDQRGLYQSWPNGKVGKPSVVSPET